jgi:hypothetical protein
MVPVADLSEAIGFSTVLVFATALVSWLVLPHHRSDMRRLPDEPAALRVLGAQVLRPGVYRFPFEGRPDDREFLEKIEKGPVGLLTVTRPGHRDVGRAVALSLAHGAAVATLVAFAAGGALPPGASFAAVFRLAGTTAVLAHAGALLPESIWWGRPWPSTLKAMADGLVSGLLTGATFAWLWPVR